MEYYKYWIIREGYDIKFVRWDSIGNKKYNRLVQEGNIFEYNKLQYNQNPYYLDDENYICRKIRGRVHRYERLHDALLRLEKKGD